MASRAADVFETLKTALKGKSLDASLKFDLGDEGVIVIDGPVVTTDNLDVDTVVTTSVDVLAEICAGRTDAVQAYYQGRLQIDGSQNATMKLSALLDSGDGPTMQIGRFSPDDDVGAIVNELKFAGAAIVENCIPHALVDKVAAEKLPIVIRNAFAS